MRVYNLQDIVYFGFLEHRQLLNRFRLNAASYKQNLRLFGRHNNFHLSLGLIPNRPKRP